MTHIKIKANIFLLSEGFITSLPSALKYWYLSIGGLSIFRPSALKCLISLFSNWRSRLNQVGIFQYTAKTPKNANPQRITDSVSNVRDKTDIMTTPVAADLRITLRSLPINLSIRVLHSLSFFYNFIVTQKSLKVYLILVIIPSFTYSFAVQASEECLAAITKYERIYRIPTGLLKAISMVESEYNPFALNDGLKSHHFKTKQEVLDRISYLSEIGKTNFDIGCMQINYHWHSKNFTSVEEMLDIAGNVRYAASFIHGLYKTHGTWQAAVRHYHSYEPSIHKQYSKKIALVWLKEKSQNELF